MNWIKKLFKKTEVKIEEPRAPSINENGEFIKADEFEKIWIAKNVKHMFGLDFGFNDDDYIDYYIWKAKNQKEMYKKHYPKALLFLGDNPNIIFHGGCLGCLSQRNHGIERCKGCCYFRNNSNLFSLYIEGEKAATLNKEQFERIIKGSNQNE